jgi:two-component system NarL family response regulator
MKRPDPIRILVVDDHVVVRLGLIAAIDSQDDMTVVAEAGNGRQALESFREHRPHIVVMDARMPVMTGVQATEAIRGEFPNARVIILTSYDGDEDIYRALRAGAMAYLLKDSRRDELLTAIRTVHDGRRYIPSAVSARLADRIHFSDLTSRELDVLRLIAKGMTNGEIAVSLKISKSTVKIHVNNILGKLGVTDRTKATSIALQRGIVHLD